MSEWKTVPLYGIAKPKQIVNCVTRDLLSVYLGKGVVPFSSQTAKRTNVTSTDLSKYQAVDYGDFVLNNQQAWRGSVGVSKYSGIVSPAYIVLKLNDEIESNYANYLFQSRSMIDQYVVCSKGVGSIQRNIYWDYLKRIMVPLPPRAEQDQIVRYLDWKVSGINRLINAKKKQIALLGEQKRAVVNEAMTRGGEGWERKSLKHWVKSNLSSLGQNTDAEFEFDYLDISSVGHGYIKQAPIRMTFGQSPSRARRIVKYGDTIMSTVRTYLRSVCFINHEYEHCIVSTGFSVLSPDETAVLPELLSFALSSDAFIDDVVKNSIGVSYPAINDSKLLTLKISLPLSLAEQQSVYDTLKEKFVTYDDLIAKVQQKICLLHEYKTRLISDVVTGKKDVRGVVVPEYEAVKESASDVCANEEETEQEDE